jgi:hypothetical protein
MTKLLSLPATPDTPVACDMTGADDTMAERLAEYRRLFEHALLERTITDSTTTLRLADRPGVRDWVLDLVQREAACCPFLSYDVEHDGNHIVWHTDGIGTSDWATLDDVIRTASPTDSSSELAQHLTERTGIPNTIDSAV